MSSIPGFPNAQANTKTVYPANSTCNGSTYFYNIFSDIDMLLSDNFLYHIGSTGSLPSNKFDLYSILIHEVGHFLSLRHANQGVMFHRLSPGGHRRPIDVDALSGVNTQKTRSIAELGLGCFVGYVLNTAAQGCMVDAEDVNKNELTYTIIQDLLQFNNLISIDKISLYGIDGKLIISRDHTSEISLSGLQSGVYVSQVVAEGKVYTFKFVHL